MRNLLGFAVLLWFISSCNKSNLTAPVLSGTYNGTFTRNFGDSSLSSNLQLIFTGGSYKGTTIGNFPLICPSNFQITSDSIFFQNPCFLPANIDEAFILIGNYKLHVQGDSLIFSRIMGDFIYEEDIYRLKKQ
jgi:hypothetical protein